MEINKFTGKYRFLSNFYEVPIIVDGIKYRSVEHAFQAAKATNELDKHIFRQCETAADAKYWGRHIKLRPDWDSVKIDIMYNLLKIKFNDDSLKKQLLSTDDAIIIEGNNHKDCYWGVYKGKGENNLGKLLMKLRAEIREGV